MNARFSFGLLVAAPLFFLAPLLVNAQAAVTHSANSNAGATTYSESVQGGSQGLVGYNTLFGAALRADALMHGNQFNCYSAHNCPAGHEPAGSGAENDFANGRPFNHGYPDNVWNTGGTRNATANSFSQPTANRLCYIIDPSDATIKATHLGYYAYNSGTPYDSTLLFDGSNWHLLENEAHYNLVQDNGLQTLNQLTCTSYALPAQTITASSYSVNSGDLVTLNWADSSYTDNLTPSQTSCTTSGFTLATTPGQSYCDDWEETYTGTSCDGNNQQASALLALVDNCQVTRYCAHYSTTTKTTLSGQATVHPTQTTTYTYSCTNPNGTTVATATVNVVGADLTAGGVTPATAKVGSAVTFSALVSNTGSSSTGTGFTNLFQKASDASGTGAVDIGTSASSAIAGNGTATTSLSYTVPAGGFYLRVCADKSSGTNGGVITESNENNNCGAWSPVNVGALPDLTASIATPVSNVAPGQQVTFTGTATNESTTTPTSAGFYNVFQVCDASAVNVGNNLGTLVGNCNTFQNVVNYLDTTPLAPGDTAPLTAQYTIPANALALKAHTTSNVAEQKSLLGKVLSWVSPATARADANSATYYYRWCSNWNVDPSNTWTQSVDESNNSNDCGAWSTITVAYPPIDPCYGQGCGDAHSCSYLSTQQPAGNSAQCCSSTPGVCPVPPTATLNPASQTINAGHRATFNWSSTNATSCVDVATPPAFDNGQTSSSGTQTGTLTQSQNFQIRCTGPTGLTALSNQASVTVVQPNAPITASPLRVATGLTTSVSWSGQFVTSCQMKGNDGYDSGVITADVNGAIATSSVTRTINNQTKYTVTCQTTTGPISNAVVVNVLPSFQEF